MGVPWPIGRLWPVGCCVRRSRRVSRRRPAVPLRVGRAGMSRRVPCPCPSRTGLCRAAQRPDTRAAGHAGSPQPSLTAAAAAPARHGHLQPGVPAPQPRGAGLHPSLRGRAGAIQRYRTPRTLPHTGVWVGGARDLVWGGRQPAWGGHPGKAQRLIPIIGHVRRCRGPCQHPAQPCRHPRGAAGSQVPAVGSRDPAGCPPPQGLPPAADPLPPPRVLVPVPDSRHGQAGVCAHGTPGLAGGYQWGLWHSRQCAGDRGGRGCHLGGWGGGREGAMGGLLLGLSMARAGAGTLGCPAAREGHRGHGTSAGARRWHRWHWHLGAQAPVLSSGIGSIGISGHGRWCSVMVSVALASQQLCGCPGLWQCPLGWRGWHVAGGAWGGSAWGRQPPTSMPLQGERELPALCLRSACTLPAPVWPVLPGGAGGHSTCRLEDLPWARGTSHPRPRGASPGGLWVRLPSPLARTAGRREWLVPPAPEPQG